MKDGNFVSRISRSASSSAAGTINITGYIFSYAARAINKHVSSLLPEHKHQHNIQDDTEILSFGVLNLDYSFGNWKAVKVLAQRFAREVYFWAQA